MERQETLFLEILSLPLELNLWKYEYTLIILVVTMVIQKLWKQLSSIYTNVCKQHSSRSGQW